MTMTTALTSAPIRVHEFRSQRVVLDQEVARLFEVETKRLNEQVNRNKEKFGDDFSFRLSKEEFADLRSQNATSSSAEWGGARYPPRVFTEHGVVMAATILKSPVAIQATRNIVRTFVQTRREAWERERQKLEGQVPATLDAPMRQALVARLNTAVGHVLDAIIDPAEETTVRDEAKAIAAEGLRSLKEYLKKAGINNEKTLAEVRRIMAEAEAIEVTAARQRTENQHRQMALLAKKRRLVIQAQLYAETGSIDGLMVVLSDLEQH